MCEVGIFVSVFQVCWVQEFYFGQVLIEIPVRYPSGSVEAKVRSSVETLGRRYRFGNCWHWMAYKAVILNEVM